ncbi:hypothetical protein JXA56_04395 [Candidatus Micrarchaeota archaeon]|nr:hypothetical protein [Candidatus Micrarchaeota archaeon]
MKTRKKDPRQDAVDRILKSKFNMTDSELEKVKLVEGMMALSGHKIEIDSLLQGMRELPEDDDYQTNAMDAANHDFTLVAVRAMIDDLKCLNDLPEGISPEVKAKFLESLHDEKTKTAIEKLREFADENELDFGAFLFYVTNNIVSAVTVFYKDDGWGDYEKRIAGHFREEEIPLLEHVNEIFAHHLEKLKAPTK